MNKSSYLEIDKTDLSDQTKMKLDKITETKNSFYQEINQGKLSSKKVRKYAAAFDYVDKIWIVLGATSGGVSIISFMSVVGAPVGIANAIFTLILP